LGSFAFFYGFFSALMTYVAFDRFFHLTTIPAIFSNDHLLHRMTAFFSWCRWRLRPQQDGQAAGRKG